MQNHSRVYTLNTGEDHINVPPWAYNSITQGTWVFSSISTGLHYFYFDNDGADANGDRINYSLYLCPGTYTFVCHWRRNTNCAIADLLIDEVSQGTKDMYGASSAIQTWTITGIVIASGGVKTVSILANGHNGSSGGYAIDLYHFTFFRTI